MTRARAAALIVALIALLVGRGFIPVIHAQTAQRAVAITTVPLADYTAPLIHDNQLNADVMPELLDMFRRRGYRFVSFDEALADEAYRLPDEYLGRGGFSWIHRRSKTKGMLAKGEPDPPRWVISAFDAR